MNASRLNSRYIANQLFGIQVDWDAFIKEALSFIKNQPNYIHAKQLLIELYETHYGVYDHTSAVNPLASVLFQESEQFRDKGLLDNYLETYIYKNVFARTGLTFDEFLNRPRFEIEKILEAVSAYNTKKSNAADAGLSALANAADGLT